MNFEMIISKLKFHSNAQDELKGIYNRIAGDEQLFDLLMQAVDIYSRENCYFEDVLAICEELETNSLIHEYAVNLILFICLTEPLRVRYQKAGIGMDIWSDTVQELKYKMIECRDRNNMLGIEDKESLTAIFELKRFTLGRLQFEIIPFGAVIPGMEYKKKRLTLTPDTPVINVLVPRMLNYLDKELLEDSYAKAAEFFKIKKPVFVYQGWRLFPDYAPVLKGLDIENFAEEYELIATSDDREGEHPDMLEVFDMRFTGNAQDYPENSILRKRFKEYLVNGGKTGRGIGVKVL